MTKYAIVSSNIPEYFIVPVDKLHYNLKHLSKDADTHYVICNQIAAKYENLARKWRLKAEGTKT